MNAGQECRQAKGLKVYKFLDANVLEVFTLHSSQSDKTDNSPSFSQGRYSVFSNNLKALIFYIEEFDI